MTEKKLTPQQLTKEIKNYSIILQDLLIPSGKVRNEDEMQEILDSVKNVCNYGINHINWSKFANYYNECEEDILYTINDLNRLEDTINLIEEYCDFDDLFWEGIGKTFLLPLFLEYEFLTLNDRLYEYEVE